jgi:hypothetical protein
VLPADRIRTLLRESDDPHHLERPQDFDPHIAAHRFAHLTRASRDRFGPTCTSGLRQDASDYGEITIPAAATGLGHPLWIDLSNFGGFVTAGTADWAGPDPTAGLTEEFVTWLDGVCTAAGCTFVPLELLLEPYDGPSALEDDEAFAALVAQFVDVSEEDETDERRLPLAWADRYFQWM